MRKLLAILVITCLAYVNLQAQQIILDSKANKKTKPSINKGLEADLDLNKSSKDREIDAPRVKVYHFSDTLDNGEIELKYGEGDTWRNEFPNIYNGLRKDLNKLRYSMQDFSTQISDELKPYRFNGFNLEQDGFSMVSVYTNKPATQVLNVRFKSVNKGTVTITVLNTIGDKVASEIVENFSGEYLGQIQLPKVKLGTYFVLISQGENAVSRKVKVE